MIHSLSIQNFLSFKDEVIISFEATRDTHLEDIHLVEVAKGIRIQKLGIVYGYNASGKSNLIEAFEFLNNFWFNILDSKEETTGVIPFMLDNVSSNKPSAFKLILYHEGIKHRYSLEITKNVVVSERLEYYPGVQPALIFERKFEDGISKIVYGPKIKISSIEEKEIAIKCIPNISVFASYIQVNTVIKEIELVVDWMRTRIMRTIEPLTVLQRFSEELVSKDKDFKTYILDYLKEADFNISNIKSNNIKEEISDEFIARAKMIGIPEVELERLEKEKAISVTDTEFEHSVIKEGAEQKFNLPIDWQSDGTKRVFGLSGAIYKAIERNAFLPIDEIESKLHPRLVEYILENFLKESESAQLLISTHYDNLFDEDDLLRKDNFWFTEKGEDGATRLYPLSGFTGLGRISSLQKAYKFGKFGAVPNID
jgi:AAA15 family ATPase/GTPase